MALGKTAVLSSEYNSNRRASKAVDGEHNYNNGYSRSKTQTNPWWRVDLLQAYNISSITIVNIEDDIPEMIDGAEIRIGNSVENTGNSNPSYGKTLDYLHTQIMYTDDTPAYFQINKQSTVNRSILFP